MDELRVREVVVKLAARSRSYFTIIQDGWEELADYALSWAVENATAAAIPARATGERSLLEGAAT